jgi:hypothetical protein
MAASERDRAHLARLGVLKERSHAEALAAHLERPILDRLRRSFALFRAHASRTASDRDDPDCSRFYERARELGLYHD